MELPFYFDHRGEINRDMLKKGNADSNSLDIGERRVNV